MSLAYIKREEWGAVAPKKWNKLCHPIKEVFYVTTNTRRCIEEIRCIQICQQLQQRHIEIGLGDIKFSFVIGGDGQVYEGRGWSHAPRLPRQYGDKYQVNVISIAFIGKWSDNNLPTLMRRSASDLIDYGIENQYLSRNYKSKSLLFGDPQKNLIKMRRIWEKKKAQQREIQKNKDMIREMGLDNELELSEEDDITEKNKR